MSIYRKGPIELRCGDYRDVLANVEPDAVITDPPYLGAYAGGGGLVRECRTSYQAGESIIRYAPASTELLSAIVGFAVGIPSVTVFVGFNDFGGVAAMLDDLRAAGWTVAEPPTWTKPTSLVPPFGGRLNVEKRNEYLAVGCPTNAHRRRTRGDYRTPSASASGLVLAGGKPLALMRAIVRDYSEPGDLVCDPCAGGATTLIAAALEGRRAIGAELDPETFAKACARIERTALTPPLPGIAAPRRMEQADLLGGDE